MFRFLYFTCMFISLSSLAERHPLQSNDMTIDTTVISPSYSKGTGSKICFDQGHNNIHSLQKGYLAFSELVQNDGYRIDEIYKLEEIHQCKILIINNPLSSKNLGDLKFPIPHHSAFSQAEIERVNQWVKDRGSLLIFSDHPPFSAATEALVSSFGATPVNAFLDVTLGARDIFTKSSGLNVLHPVIVGRANEAPLSKIMTFDGHGYYVSEDWTPILKVKGEAIASLHPKQIGYGTWKTRPKWKISEVVQAATRGYEKGKVAYVAESAMCTAQVFYKKKKLLGFNHPDATQNKQFCINLIRWLDGLIQ